MRDYGTGTWDGGDPDCDHTRGNAREDHSRHVYSGTRGEQPSSAAAATPYKDKCGRCGAGRTDAQIGLEATPEDYVATMVEVFREVRRVLRNDGTLWLNLGDSYSAAARGSAAPETSTLTNPTRHLEVSGAPIDKRTNGLKPKDLVGVPWRVAFALQADGWWLRSDIIWAKPNPMPESIRDRPTKAHEYLFLLTKSERYYYDAEAIKTRSDRGGEICGTGPKSLSRGQAKGRGVAPSGNAKRHAVSPSTANCRTVWTIPTQPFHGAHFAVFPPALVEPCVKAGTSERGCCSSCGAPWERVVERAKHEAGPDCKYDPGDPQFATKRNLGGNYQKQLDANPPRTTGWEPGCDCGADVAPCTVLDPFAGAGTTLLVATDHGRDAVGIELSEEYANLARERIRAHNPLFANEIP